MVWRWVTAEMNASHRPLVMALAALLGSWFGLEGAPYHYLALAIHVAAALLLYGLLSRMSDATRRGRIAAAAASLYFLAYPRHEEAVYWFAAVSYPLAAFFGLLFLHAHLRSEPSGSPGWAILAATALAAALASHPAAVAFLAAAAALALGPSREAASRARPRWALALYGLVVVAALGLTLWFRHDALPIDKGAGVRLIVRGFLRLAASVGWPAAMESGRQPIDLTLVIVALALLALSVGQRRRAGLMGATLLTASVAVSAVAFPDVLAARYHYLPALGMALCLASVASTASPAPGLRRLPGPTAALAIMAVTTAFGLGWNHARAEAWNRAGALAASAFRSIRCRASAEPAKRLALFGAPETLDRAFVLNNGLPELFALAGDRREVHSAGWDFSSLLAAAPAPDQRSYLWLGPDGWIDVSPDRRGSDLLLTRPGDGRLEGMSEVSVRLRTPRRAGRAFIFARADDARARMAVVLNERVLAHLSLTYEPGVYSLPLPPTQDDGVLRLRHLGSGLRPGKPARPVLVPLVLIAASTGRADACGRMAP